MNCLPDDIVMSLSCVYHEEYMKGVVSRNELDTSKPSHVSWDLLPEKYRQSNVRQVNEICRTVVGAGYGFAALDDGDLADSVEFDLDQIETIARREHDQWVRDMQSHGFRRGPEHIDTGATKTHPDICHWDDLSEATRDKDRLPYLDFATRLRRVGYALVVRPD